MIADCKILIGDVRDRLRELPDESVQCVVTSPPYWGLRDYGVKGQIGLEQTPEEFVSALVEVFRALRRVLKNDGTAWLNLGDTYCGSGRGGNVGGASTLQGSRDNQEQSRIARGSQKSAGLHESAVNAGAIGRAWVAPAPGLKQKDLVGIPWRVAFALQSDGWWLRQDIIWHKPNPMPESVTDRCTKAHEYIFLLSKSSKYYFDQEAIQEPADYADCGRESVPRGGFDGKNTLPGKEAFRAIRETRNKRSVWKVPTTPYEGAHFAVFPPDLIRPCILAGSKPGDTVLDPFGGSGTTGVVALEYGRNAILIDLNPANERLMSDRIAPVKGQGLLTLEHNE